MNSLKISVLNVALGAVLVCGLSACNRDANADVSYRGDGSAAPGVAAAPAPAGPKYGRVVSVDPVREAASSPQRECHDEVVTRHVPVRDEHQLAGTAIGAVAGGLLGNQIGGGKGRTLATVAGAVGGGYAGNKVQEGMQERDTYTTTQTRCNTVNDISDKVVGYDVRYSLDGKEGKVRMDRDPGNQIPVDKEGKLILSQNEPAQ